MRFVKNFRTTNNQFLKKILAPEVFNYVDSKSKNGHRAKNLWTINPPPTFFRNGKSCFYSSALFYNYKNDLPEIL